MSSSRIRAAVITVVSAAAVAVPVAAQAAAPAHHHAHHLLGKSEGKSVSAHHKHARAHRHAHALAGTTTHTTGTHRALPAHHLLPHQQLTHHLRHHMLRHQLLRHHGVPMMLRHHPEANAKVAGELRAGDSFRVLRTHGEWSLIKDTTTGAVGWVHVQTAAAHHTAPGLVPHHTAPMQPTIEHREHGTPAR